MNMKYNKMRCNLISAFVAASLIIPAIAQAGSDEGNGNGGVNNGKQYGKDKGDATVTSTPEPNTAIVLIPFLGAVLVVGTMHLWRRQKNAGSV
jgi:hypothetical protein